MIILKDTEKLNKEQLAALIGIIKAIVYVRVSSDGQVDNYSIESQIERCVTDAKQKFQYDENEIIILCEEAESGDNPNRPMLNYVLFLLKKGIGNKVIFLHPDRLSRYLHLQQQISHQIWELGCDLHFVEFDLNRDNAESMLNFNIQGSIAQYNKAKILANTKRGRKTMLSKGKIPGFNRIYGYTYDRDHDTLVENTVEKERYQQMVKMILRGSSCSEVARYFSKKKYEAPKGDKWYQSTISRILRNEAYKGTFFYGKTEVVQKLGVKTQVDKPKEEWQAVPIPSYIDDSEFEQLQKCLDANVKSNKNSGRPSDGYLLKGIVRCGRCKSAVTSGVTTKTKNGTLKYYTCTKKTKKFYSVETGEHNMVCRGRNWRVDKVDDVVWAEVKAIISNPKRLIDILASKSSDEQFIKELHQSKSKLLAEIKEKEAAKERYIDLYASGFIKSKQELTVKLEPAQLELEELNNDVKNINEKLQASKFQDEQIDIAVMMLQSYEEIIQGDLTIQEKRKILSVFVEKVILHDDNRIEILYRLITNKDEIDETSSGDTHVNLVAGQSDGGPQKPICPYIGRVFRRNRLFSAVQSRASVPFSDPGGVPGLFRGSADSDFGAYGQRTGLHFDATGDNET